MHWGSLYDLTPLPFDLNKKNSPKKQKKKTKVYEHIKNPNALKFIQVL